MPPIDFTPAHAQPFTLEQAMQLEVELLANDRSLLKRDIETTMTEWAADDSAEVARLQNSILHLRQTQDELEGFLAEEGEEVDEDGELRKAILENQQVIASQSERITLIKIALLNKVGEGGMRHYGYDDPPDPPKTTIQPPPPPTTIPNQSQPRTPISAQPSSQRQSPSQDEGMYL